MAFLDGRLVSHFADGNLLAKLMMSPYEEEKDNEWARNERVNSKITVSCFIALHSLETTPSRTTQCYVRDIPT